MREPASSRLGSTPTPVWAYGIVSVAIAPYVGVVINDYRLDEPLAWTGASLGLLITAGLALRWRAVWVAAFGLEVFLAATALATAVASGMPGVVMLVKSLGAMALLLSAATRTHVFGSATWQEPAPGDRER